jgi:3-hydroxybutyrate dehydrogenase
VRVIPVDLRGDRCFHADVATDEGNRSMVEYAITKFGRLDILVLNAGLQFMAPISEFPEAQWDRLLSVMAKGPFLAMKHGWPWLLKQPDGRIIVTASGTSAGAPFKVAYVAAKYAALGVVHVAAREAAGTSLTVNAIAPGWMDTPLLRNQIGDHVRLRGLTRKQVVQDMLGDQPGGRFVEPVRVAEVVAFLASPDSSGISGACIPVYNG